MAVMIAEYVDQVVVFEETSRRYFQISEARYLIQQLCSSYRYRIDFEMKVGTASSQIRWC